MPSGANFRIAILASGSGSNADKICNYFAHHPDIRVGLILTNNPKAGVIGVAEKHHIPCFAFPKSNWKEPYIITPLFQEKEITHIILAGFLLLVPSWLITLYPDHIVNIHPALLPKHGGKGMYGHHVHQSVKNAGDLVSGITIHEVNEHYDDGTIIFQHEVELEETDSPAEIGAKVLRAEHYYYPRVIERWITGKPIVHTLDIHPQ